MAVFDPMRLIREQLSAGASEEDIEDELREYYAILPDVSKALIRQVKVETPEVMALREQSRKDIRRGERRTWFWPVGIGVGLFTMGVAITAITFAMAGPGGTYIVTGGLMLVGVLSVLKGLWHLIRWW